MGVIVSNCTPRLPGMSPNCQLTMTEQLWEGKRAVSNQHSVRTHFSDMGLLYNTTSDGYFIVSDRKTSTQTDVLICQQLYLKASCHKYIEIFKRRGALFMSRRIRMLWRRSSVSVSCQREITLYERGTFGRLK